MTLARCILSVDGLHLIVQPCAASDGGSPVFAWWKIENGRLVQSGDHVDVRQAAGCAEDHAPDCVTLLLTPDDCAVRINDAGDMTIAQALAAANIDARGSAIDADDILHSVAVPLTGSRGSLKTVSAVVRRDLLHARLEQLNMIGLQPDHILPGAAVMMPVASGYRHFVLGDQAYLCGEELAAADDLSLRQALLIDDEPALFAEKDVYTALAALPLAHIPDLCSGDFVKNSGGAWFSRSQKNLLAGLALALFAISLVIPAVRLWIYDSAEQDVVTGVLAKVQQDFPNADNMATARTQVDDALLRKGAGASVFSAPASALLLALERSPGATIEALRYQSDGAITVTLRASDVNVTNAVLRDLQENQGYGVDCPNCQTPDQTAWEVTVRG